MADPKKVHWSQLKIGIVGLFACLIIFLLVFLLTSSRGIFQKKAMLRTYMDDASGIMESTPVRLNGFLIGSLDKVRLTNSTDPKRAVKFVREVQEKYHKEIPIDSVAGVSASNLLDD